MSPPNLKKQNQRHLSQRRKGAKEIFKSVFKPKGFVFLGVFAPLRENRVCIRFV
jgi:hypothetical protein